MQWTRGILLGRGSSGATVSSATSIAGDIFAVKSAELSHSETLQREQKFLSGLSSPYIVSYKGCEITKEDNKLMYNLLMQYMPGGTVIDATLGRSFGQLNEPEISNYTRDIIKGLEYLHSRGIVHCDVKGANILVGENGVKIADLGCAKRVSEGGVVRGSPVFMAPEVARGEEQGFPADVWAVGCVVIEMATGGLPWGNVDDPVSVLYKIGFSGESPEIPGGFSLQAKDFIGKCLIRDPRERWTVKDLLKHPFLEEFNHQTEQTICQDLKTDSPTSVLDQDVWDSVDESPLVGTDSIQLTCSSYPVRQRIKQLAGNTRTCSSWSVRQRIKQLVGNSEKAKRKREEMNWITIRSSDSGGAVAGGC